MRRVLSICALAASALVIAGPAEPRTGVAPWTHWICLPGRQDACQLAPTVTVVSAGGAKTVERVTAGSRPIDCFYLYPTVSTEKRGNSTLQVTWDEAGTAITQASQFSRLCRVYAPMYRQVTVYGHDDPYHGNSAYEYDDALAAWNYYLVHYNQGRGVVLIGHSEGADLIEQLIENQIEASPQEQKLLVSAIVLGGSMSVKDGSTTGGDFTSVPACTSATETGCVVAYSSWDRTPPSDARFETVYGAGQHILCVNPAAPGSDAAIPITPLFPNFASEGLGPYVKVVPSIVWYEYPGLYTARCVQQGTRAWLRVSRVGRAGDKRPEVQEISGPTWGLHAADVNVDLVNLLALVASQSRAWTVRH